MTKSTESAVLQPHPVRELVGGGVRVARRVSARLERLAYRRLLAVGHRANCPVCGWHGVGLLPSSKPRTPDRMCPKCGSTERDRALELWLRRTTAGTAHRILEIAPIRLVEPTAVALDYQYVSLDLHSPHARVKGDLCHTPFRSNSFDIIVCFHVLEHILDDQAAMAEIGRLLSPAGVALIVVPWDPDRPETFEGESDDPADNLRLYGQSDHVRIYGNDVTHRMRAAGLSVDEIQWNSMFTPDVFQNFRLASGNDDRFWVCTSPS